MEWKRVTKGCIRDRLFGGSEGSEGSEGGEGTKEVGRTQCACAGDIDRNQVWLEQPAAGSRQQLQHQAPFWSWEMRAPILQPKRVLRGI